MTSAASQLDHSTFRLRQALRRFVRRCKSARASFTGRIHPMSRAFGMDRGRPIDRYYIERFLAAHANDIRGRVLEIAESTYTERFGGDRVTRSDVLHVQPDHPGTTIVGDLTKPETVPAGAFDCIIITQTLMFIYDLRAAIATLHDMLRPGGVALITVAGISQVPRYDRENWGDYWRFTDLAIERLLTERFEKSNIRVGACGNVLVAGAFLAGWSVEELRARELEHHDPDYQVIITARAVRAAE